MHRPTDQRHNLFSVLLNFYLFSNIHIAVCAVALTGVTQIFFDFHLRSELYVFVFCGTFFLYNLQRLPAAFANAHIERKFMRHSWNTQHRWVLLFISVLTAVAALWAFSQLYLRTQVIAMVPAAISVAYAFRVIPWKGRWIKLREIPGIKIFLVGLVWGMSCVWVPAAADGSYPAWTSPEVTAWFIACSLMIFAITVPFDIRDLHYDGLQLRTLPSILGIRKAVVVSISGLLLSALGVFLADNLSTLVTTHHAIIYAVWTLITCVIVAWSKPTHHEYYYSLLIDGLMIVLWAMLRFI